MSIPTIIWKRPTPKEPIGAHPEGGRRALGRCPGRLRGAKVLLRPAPETRAEIGPGKGARHSSAAKMSAEAQCLAITVSQDGPISAYFRGGLILSL